MYMYIILFTVTCTLLCTDETFSASTKFRFCIILFPTQTFIFSFAAPMLKLSTNWSLIMTTYLKRSNRLTLGTEKCLRSWMKCNSSLMKPGQINMRAPGIKNEKKLWTVWRGYSLVSTAGWLICVSQHTRSESFWFTLNFKLNPHFVFVFALDTTLL